ncbi:tRNA glutamyl-Q(34) synthetase GluQRS [Segnochrobactraceae bacterium EtOH-i3]
MTRPLFRLAPSPTGRLHAGHALSAFLNRDLARATGGVFLVRIEDIDPTRRNPEVIRALLDDLAWLGIVSDGPVRFQSAHLDDYRRALDRLQGMGLVEPSRATRTLIRAAMARDAAAGHPWPEDPDGAPRFPGDAAVLSEADHARLAALGEPVAGRLVMAPALAAARARDPATGDWDEFDPTAPLDPARRTRVAGDPAAWGHVVIARKETPTSYPLSVVVDDALQGVTHVVRGADLFAQTSLHRLLQTLLGLPAPVYHHHRLIRDADGGKLSKSLGSVSLADLRAGGATPADVRRLVGLADVAGKT